MGLARVRGPDLWGLQLHLFTPIESLLDVLEQPQAPLLAPLLGLSQQAAQLGGLLRETAGCRSRTPQLGFMHLSEAPLQPCLLFGQKPSQSPEL